MILSLLLFLLFLLLPAFLSLSHSLSLYVSGLENYLCSQYAPRLKLTIQGKQSTVSHVPVYCSALCGVMRYLQLSQLHDHGCVRSLSVSSDLQVCSTVADCNQASRTGFVCAASALTGDRRCTCAPGFRIERRQPSGRNVCLRGEALMLERMTCRTACS